MNEKNYASLEASQRLVDAGIVLESDNGRFILYSDHLVALAEKDKAIKVFQDDTIMRKAHIEHLEEQIATLKVEVTTLNQQRIEWLDKAMEISRSNCELQKQIASFCGCTVVDQAVIPCEYHTQWEMEKDQNILDLQEQIAALTAERDRFKESLERGCQNESECCPYYQMNEIEIAENKRLRQIVIDCHDGWPDEVLQKALRGGERVAKVIKDKYEGLAEMNEGLRDNKRYLENELALKMEQITDLKKRLAFICDVWGRWKDFARTSYPTIEQTHHALYDFGKAIKKAMTGYNPE